MLALIGEALRQRGIDYALLTGDSRDRRAPVEDFQQGRVPLFLISLKAGGVGLNLTAADTVIHYDPWWNPAAENQASDRAYRIGQDKPVFVYKLIARGTVEEKIQLLQREKAALAAGILEGAGADWQLDDADTRSSRRCRRRSSAHGCMPWARRSVTDQLDAAVAVLPVEGAGQGEGVGNAGDQHVGQRPDRIAETVPGIAAVGPRGHIAGAVGGDRAVGRSVQPAEVVDHAAVHPRDAVAVGAIEQRMPHVERLVAAHGVQRAAARQQHRHQKGQ
jgi:hypothetical protein